MNGGVFFFFCPPILLGDCFLAYSPTLSFWRAGEKKGKIFGQERGGGEYIVSTLASGWEIPLVLIQLFSPHQSIWFLPLIPHELVIFLLLLIFCWLLYFVLFSLLVSDPEKLFAFLPSKSPMRPATLFLITRSWLRPNYVRCYWWVVKPDCYNNYFLTAKIHPSTPSQGSCEMSVFWDQKRSVWNSLNLLLPFLPRRRFVSLVAFNWLTPTSVLFGYFVLISTPF